MKFTKNYIIKGRIVCETGLHIGAPKESITIGDVDNIILRDPLTRYPYIPGSSIKGKIRSLLELNRGQIDEEGGPCKCGKCEICTIFGSPAQSSDKGPTRIIFRDCFPTKETIEMWNLNNEIVDGAELKYENSLNRITAEANPRPQERVPKDSKFEFEIVLSVYEGDNGTLKTVFEGMRLLEDSYLGGSGTRGYGKIKFDEIAVKERSIEYYKGEDGEKEIYKGENVRDILDKLKSE